jgi:hypothetical protein
MARFNIPVAGQPALCIIQAGSPKSILIQNPSSVPVWFSEEAKVSLLQTPDLSGNPASGYMVAPGATVPMFDSSAAFFALAIAGGGQLEVLAFPFCGGSK